MSTRTMFRHLQARVCLRSPHISNLKVIVHAEFCITCMAACMIHEAWQNGKTCCMHGEDLKPGLATGLQTVAIHTVYCSGI